MHRDMVTYFMALTLRPDEPAARVEVQTQTDGVVPAVPAADEASQAEVAAHDATPSATGAGHHRPLVYAALLGSKSEATEAIKVSWRKSTMTTQAFHSHCDSDCIATESFNL